MTPSSISRLQDMPPASWARATLLSLSVLVFCLLLWAALGQLDIVAVAPGKLVPQTYLKIVQPAEQGIVKEILVREGEQVKQGQVLMRMDATVSGADRETLVAELRRHRLALRRIDAELSGIPLTRQAEPGALFAEILAQYHANRLAYLGALAEQRSVLEKANQDLAGAREVETKLRQILPHYRRQEQAYDELSRDGFASRIMAADKQRERIEKEQDLRSQQFAIRGIQATRRQAQQRMAQISADYRRQLQTERVETAGRLNKLEQELTKQQYRDRLMELRAPQDGVVKDLATHTVGTVTEPGTVLLTLVPKAEPLQAEVWIANEDIGFVHPRQAVKLKLGAFAFQKYGMMQGVVEQVSADSSDAAGPERHMDTPAKTNTQLAYKARVALQSQRLLADGRSYLLSPGMQVTAEIHLGRRSVLEYLLSPVSGAFHEAARER